MQHLFEHPTGVFLHVQYTARKARKGPVRVDIQDVRLAGVDYEPVGPNLATFLHHAYSINDGGTLATPLLEQVAQDLPV